MPIRTNFIRVGKLFLKEVFDEFKKLRQRLGDSKELKQFDLWFDLTKKPKDFFKLFYKTRLMRAETMEITSERKPRTARFVTVFGYLRTIFLGVLSGDPRVGFLSKRIHRYKKTINIINVFEDFIKLYRKTIGFNKKTVADHILASGNVFSECERKPANLCLPPSCEYIHHTRRSKGYCRTKKTRKNKSTSTTRSHSHSS